MRTKATREELGDLGVMYARLFEFVKNGKRPAGLVIAGMQRLADGQLPENTRFVRYKHLLLSLGNQLERLRYYNSTYWDNRLTDEQLAAVDTTGDITQWVDDLTTFHVHFDSLVETIEMWWRVYIGEQPSLWRWDELKLDTEHLRLLASNVHWYEPGIYRIRINLAAHWDPKSSNNVEDAREQAKGSNETLAHLEVLSAYGLHRELFREQDGRNLPYSNIPGANVSVPGHSYPYAMQLLWTDARVVHFSADTVTSRNSGFASPVLRGF